MAISKSIEEKTSKFINKYINESTSLPIKIDEIIAEEDIAVEYRHLKDDLSGLLITQGDSKLIGVENTHSSVRQRFTLAHELGHYVLHNEISSMFMDTVLFKRQSEGYTSREERMEKEANYFAANILMPESIVRRELNSFYKDLNDEDNVRELAEKFDVSLPAMTFRLINLGYI